MEGSPDSSALATVLAGLAETLAGELDLDRLLPQIVTTARNATGAPYAALGVLDEDATTIVHFSHQGIDAATIARMGSTPTGGGLLGELIEHPHLIVTDELSGHPASDGFPPHHPPMHSFLGTPIRAWGRVFGNLYLTDKPGGFDQRDIDIVTVLATQAGLAIQAIQMADELRMVAVQDDRERISRDLHDGVIQSLFSIGMSLEADYPLIRTEPERIESRMNTAIDQLDTAIKDLRAAIFTLRHDGTDVVGLKRGLVQLVAEYRRSGQLTPSINIESTIDRIVPADLVPDILHIVREALSNAAWHAQSATVEITARTDAGGLLVEVVDNGKGFDADTVVLGHGLGNMAERAAILGADLRIQSKPATGTTVGLRIPLDGHRDVNR